MRLFGCAKPLPQAKKSGQKKTRNPIKPRWPPALPKSNRPLLRKNLIKNRRRADRAACDRGTIARRTVGGLRIQALGHNLRAPLRRSSFSLDSAPETSFLDASWAERAHAFWRFPLEAR